MKLSMHYCLRARRADEGRAYDTITKFTAQFTERVLPKLAEIG